LIYTYGHGALQPINSWCNNKLEIGEKNLSWLGGGWPLGMQRFGCAPSLSERKFSVLAGYSKQQQTTTATWWLSWRLL